MTINAEIKSKEWIKKIIKTQKRHLQKLWGKQFTFVQWLDAEKKRLSMRDAEKYLQYSLYEVIFEDINMALKKLAELKEALKNDL